MGIYGGYFESSVIGKTLRPNIRCCFVLRETIGHQSLLQWKKYYSIFSNSERLFQTKYYTEVQSVTER